MSKSNPLHISSAAQRSQQIQIPQNPINLQNEAGDQLSPVNEKQHQQRHGSKSANNKQQNMPQAETNANNNNNNTQFIYNNININTNSVGPQHHQHAPSHGPLPYGLLEQGQHNQIPNHHNGPIAHQVGHHTNHLSQSHQHLHSNNHQMSLNQHVSHQNLPHLNPQTFNVNTQINISQSLAQNQNNSINTLHNYNYGTTSGRNSAAPAQEQTPQASQRNNYSHQNLSSTPDHLVQNLNLLTVSSHNSHNFSNNSRSNNVNNDTNTSSRSNLSGQSSQNTVILPPQISGFINQNHTQNTTHNSSNKTKNTNKKDGSLQHSSSKNKSSTKQQQITSQIDLSLNGHDTKNNDGECHNDVVGETPIVLSPGKKRQSAKGRGVNGFGVLTIILFFD